MEKDRKKLTQKEGTYTREKTIEKTPETKILGPAIEGMGLYPEIDHNLKVRSPKHNVYCLGDNTGIFRGIIPCMISGIYLARSFHYNLTKKITFVTGNENKIRETERIIGPLTISRMDLPEFWTLAWL